MTSWKTYRLGDIASFSQGIQVDIDKQLPYKKGGYVRFIRIVDFTKANEPYRYIETPKKQYLTNSGDIVMIRYGSQTAGLVVKSFEGAIANNMFKITLDEQVVDRDFIYYALSQEDIFSSLRNAQSSSTMPAITFEIASRIQLKIPSLEEQRRIAGILGAIDDKIENNRRINTNLELQAQTLFEEWISKSKTSKGVFNDIIQTTLAGDWGQETTQGNYTHEVYCIRGADIPSLRNGDKGKMPIRYILEKNYKAKQLRASDLVIEISGGSPTQSTGRICMITQSLLDRLAKDVVCTNFCRAITPKYGYAIYIYLYWQMLYSKNTMFSYENGTTGIKNLNITDLISKEPIDIPKQEDVDKLNVVLQPIYDQIYANGLQNETLATLRDTLLPKLMNGEIITK